MELARELFTEVLNDRVHDAAFNFNNNESSCCPKEDEFDVKIKSMMAGTNRFLADGVPIAVHVLMGHENCKATERELCTAAQKLEVWTFRIQKDAPREVTGRPPMLPLFLKQAIRSQLHFSPFRSWLAAHKDSKLPDGLCPLLRISTSTHFSALPSSSAIEQLQSHQFPPCRIDQSLPVPNSTNRKAPMSNGSTSATFWLHVQVQWLKKEYFLTKAPMCPEIRMEQDELWVRPESRESSDGDIRCCSQGSARNDVKRNGNGSETEEDKDSESEDSSLSLSSTHKSRSPSMSRWKAGTGLEKDEMVGRRVGLSRQTAEVTDGIVDDDEEEEERKRKMEQEKDDEEERKKALEEASIKHQKASTRTSEEIRIMKTPEIPAMPSTSNAQQQSHPIPMLTTTPRFHPRTRLPLHSSPVPPVFRRRQQQSAAKNNQQQREETGNQQKECRGSRNTSFPASPVVSPMARLHIESPSKWGWHAPDRLVCNFEESMLGGRIVPNSIVDGFRLQLIVIGRPLGSTSMRRHQSMTPKQHLSLPVRTYFFNDLTDVPLANNAATRGIGAPSPLHLARCELEANGVPIPRRCTLQVVLFNPHGSVVKLFMIDVDVQDMPANSRTFIRQRTFSGGDTNNENVVTGIDQSNNMPTKQQQPMTSYSDDHHHKTGNHHAGSSFSSTPNGKPSTATPSLRFLIHLRLASDGQARVFLHGDIRILFSNKATDLEGLESVIDKTGSGDKTSTTGDGTTVMRAMIEMPQMPKYSPIK